MSEETKPQDTELRAARMLMTLASILVCVAMTYTFHFHYSVFGELFKGMVLQIPLTTKLILFSGVGRFVPPVLGLIAVGFALPEDSEKAIKAQAVLILCMFGFGLLVVQSVIKPLFQLIENLQ